MVRTSEDRRKVYRRGYVKYAGIVAIAAAGSGGIIWGMWAKDRSDRRVAPLETSYMTQTPGPISSMTRGKRPSTPVGGRSVVALVKGNSDTEIDTLVRNCVDAVGGMDKIVSSGETVVVKPPVISSNRNCAPDPRVVAAVVKLVKEVGGEVIVAESSGSGDTYYNLDKIGMTSAVKKAGAEVKGLQREEEVSIKIPMGVDLHEVKTYPTIINCDILISVPRLKRHSVATVTISLKNMMGTIPKDEMRRFHRVNLSQCIADLNTVIRPALTVVDATSAMTRTGPIGGDMIRLDAMIASEDPVAADRIAAQELQKLEEMIGLPSNARFKASQVKHINAAAALGVGVGNFDDIDVTEEDFQ